MTTQERGTREIPGLAGPEHALALELVRVTEAAAIAAGRWVGHGDMNSCKTAAVDAMHGLMRTVSMRGTVVIGEGDELRRGADVGDGDGPACDVGLSVGDGALSMARDVPHAIAAIAVAGRGAMYAPSTRYMDKLAVGPDCADVVDINRPVAANLRAVARAKDVGVPDLVVAVLNRPRHRELVHQIRGAGARVHLIEGGDVAGAIAAARPEGPVDLLLGTGGAAAGVVAAAALSCMGGALQARLRPNDVERGATGEVLHTADLVGEEGVLFCATGVTRSELLQGVQRDAGRTITQSIVLCSNPDTVRIVKSEYQHAHDG